MYKVRTDSADTRAVTADARALRAPARYGSFSSLTVNVTVVTSTGVSRESRTQDLEAKKTP